MILQVSQANRDSNAAIKSNTKDHREGQSTSDSSLGRGLFLEISCLNVNGRRHVGLDIREYGCLIVMKYFQCDVVVQEQSLQIWGKGTRHSNVRTASPLVLNKQRCQGQGASSFTSLARLLYFDLDEYEYRAWKEENGKEVE